MAGMSDQCKPQMSAFCIHGHKWRKYMTSSLDDGQHAGQLDKVLWEEGDLFA